MSRFCRFLVFAWLTTVWAGSNVFASDALPIERGMGRAVANFSLNDTAGRQVRLYGFSGKKAVVIVFIGTGCPVSDLYLPRLAQMAKDYEPKGVVFLAIDSNQGEDAAKVAKHVSEHGASFTVLMDPKNVVADALQAERTCEALVIDGANARLRYRGAIDDQYAPKTHKERATRSYLADALGAVVEGREVETKATVVAGCPIERVEPEIKVYRGPVVRPAAPEIVAAREAAEKPVAVGAVNYSTDVAPIVQRKCQECHRPGQVGPFSLLSFDDTKRHAASIREAVDDRRMPPWHADPRYGRFANDRSLSAQERATLLAWVDQGTPQGDPKKEPAARDFPEGWRIGKPDVVLEMPEPYTVSAQGTLPYQYFRVPTGFTEDTWIQAAEARPGDRSVVHHIIVGLDDHRGSLRRGVGTGEGAYLALYVPGDAPSIFPPGSAKLVPAGSDLILQMHYTPVGRAKVDRSSVGLIFAKSPVKYQVVTHGIVNSKFSIPAGDPNYAVEAKLTLPADVRVVGLAPHMHLRGKSFQYTAVFPDGKQEVLLSVPAYDFGWQSTYRLAEPKLLPQGTRLECLAHYDNSSGNPANPDPTQTVRWGEQTFNEMLIGYVDYVIDAPAKKAAEPTVAVQDPKAAAAALLGTWKRTEGDASAEFTINADRLELSLSRAPFRVKLEADYATTSDGTVFGRVRTASGGLGVVPNDVFGFAFTADDQALQIRDWKGTGVMAKGAILQGTYARAAGSAKSQ